jgi:PKHD-type hydroxylase|tara:strand:- start:1320 stop:1895 length:576 start_codon:yes stop_codon:yes gene_type:complete
MQHLFTPQATKREQFAWWEGAFTEKELDWLQGKAKEATQEALVGDGLVNPEIRRSETSWLSNDKDSRWVFEKLSHVVSSLNAEYFGFNLLGFGEKLQLTNYHENKQGMYGWHQDFGGAGPSRKLSVAVQLSDPSEYEGGNLEILTSRKPETMGRQRGLITVFPAWTLHQVTPVVKGTRQSLVTWVSGEPFR